MFEIYNRELSVSPFAIVPIALVNKEAAFVLGPARLTQSSAKIIGTLYGPISANGWTNPVICQIMAYCGEVLIANTIQTGVEDADSGRFGLKLTYGALINKDAFLQFSAVCSRVFNRLEQYFQDEFGAPMTLVCASHIVSRFQEKDTEVEGLISAENTDDLLTHFEHTFFVDREGFAGVSRKIKLIRRRRRILSVTRRATMPKLEHSRTFWKSVDEEFSSKDKKRPDRSSVGRVDFVQAPPHLIQQLEEMSRLRGFTSNELAIRYLAAGLRQDLAQLSADRFISEAARILRESSLSEDEQNATIAKIRHSVESETKAP